LPEVFLCLFYPTKNPDEMKTISKILVASLLTILMYCMPCTSNVYGQPYTTVPPGLTSSGQNSGSTTEKAPSAPIGEGLFILLTVGIAYTVKILFKPRKGKTS
jgi:hypothetical protein